MNLQVFHGGADISEFLIEYKREQKICSGIGTLDLTLSTTYTAPIDTWDSFTLYEEGRLVGIYYVNIVKDSQPEGSISVYCQDNSKRLSDYYIAENYLIDYPSLTGTWIKQFLGEAGVDDFELAGLGEPLSENTSLGMASAYEQILLLMQMSGLYMHFEGNKCFIGELESSHSDGASNLSNLDILEMKLVKHDKMLRNRALVLGAGNAVTGKQVTADLHRHTNYNYDKNDLRTVVVSNSAIPDKPAATAMASKLLSAFNRITVEKHIKLHGARNIKIGDFVSVENSIWSGVGMVTTVGSSMSEQGLFTNLILDERCPRLFTCFNPSNPTPDFVYASTTTSGVFRKGLDESTWTPYSSGLINMNIVDLYVNQGILSCIDSSGIAYKNTEWLDNWTPITLSGFEYNYYRDGGVPDSIYSGFISARAIIQDKTSNNIRIAADNRITPVEWNYADWVTNQTFVAESPGNLGWLVDINSSTGIVSDYFPVTPSGYSNICLLDIENDGRNDYISAIVMSSGFFIPTSGIDNEPNFGNAYQYTGTNTGALISFPIGDSTKSTSNLSTSGSLAIYVVDNYEDRRVVWVKHNGATNNNSYTLTVYKVVDGIFEFESSTAFSLNNFNTTASTTIHSVSKKGSVYHVYYSNDPLSAPDYPYDVSLIEITPGGSTSESSVFSQNTLPYSLTSNRRFSWKIINNSLYMLYIQWLNDVNGNPDFYLILHTINLDTEVHTSETVFSTTTETNHVRTKSNYLDLLERNNSPYWTVVYADEDTDSGGVFTNDIDIIAVRNGTSSLVYEVTFSDAGGRFRLPKVLQYNYKNFLSRISYYMSDTSYILVTCTDLTASATLITSPDTSLSTYTVAAQFSDRELAIIRNSADSKFYTVGDKETCGSLIEFTIPSFTVYGFYPNPDSSDNCLYIYGDDDSEESGNQIIGVSAGFTQIKKLHSVNAGTGGNIGNMFLSSTSAVYIDNIPGLVTVIDYEVFRRDGTVFSGVHQGISGDRLDISNQMPITAGGVGLYDTNFLSAYQEIISDVSIPVASGDAYNDHRYMEVTDLASGVLNKYFLYSTVSGIMQSLLGEGLALGETTVIFPVTSGIPTQIETTNFLYTDQYIFTAVSGSFFQTNLALSGVWNEYKDGLPSGVIITRVRADDRA